MAVLFLIQEINFIWLTFQLSHEKVVLEESISGHQRAKKDVLMFRISFFEVYLPCKIK